MLARLFIMSYQEKRVVISCIFRTFFFVVSFVFFLCLFKLGVVKGVTKYMTLALETLWAIVLNYARIVINFQQFVCQC